jgi:glutathione synthase/RimK-type ligase-like ATP-grasp enzyme
MTKKIKIGLMLGNEISMPDAFEEIIKKLNFQFNYENETYEFETERVMVEPFNLRYEPDFDVVIDRVSHWHIVPREWLKKISFDGVYLFNDPFTFQSMEKHTGFSAMAKLGMHIPPTWLLPQKDQSKLLKEAVMTYNKMFNLEEIADSMGYPVYLKPYDGGGWVGVSKASNKEELHEVYDKSGTMTLHMQKGIDFEKFIRSLCVGPQVLSMKYNPDNPLHQRYEISHNFLNEKEQKEARQIAKIINAFFGWEYNSCEVLAKDGTIYPIDYANAVPDSSLFSLHFYFPWIVKALIKWSLYCGTTNREFRFNKNVEKYLEISKLDLSYEEKLNRYEQLADEYFETEKFEKFCDKYLKEFDLKCFEYFSSKAFDEVLKKEIMKKFPEHEHDQFIAYYRDIMNSWIEDEKKRLNIKEMEA